MNPQTYNKLRNYMNKYDQVTHLTYFYIKRNSNHFFNI